MSIRIGIAAADSIGYRAPVRYWSNPKNAHVNHSSEFGNRIA